MGKYIRILIAIIAILGLILVAKSPVAATGQPDEGQSLQTQTDLSMSVGGDDCDDDRRRGDECCDDDDHRYRDECDDDDDHEDCDDDDDEDCDDDGGTVVPPDDKLEICKKGVYSIGGAVTIEVKKIRKNECFKARLKDPDSLKPPKKSKIVSDILDLDLRRSEAKLRICFAVPPGKKVTISSYIKGSWKNVGTQIKKGVACGSVSRSGAYALVTK
jgi:hypothetical protein